MDNLQTKKEIAECLKLLAHIYPFDKISVKHIIKTAHIGRTTFYYRFDDKYTLVNWIFDEDIKMSLRHNPDKKKIMPRDVMELMYNDRKYYTSIFNSSAALLLQNKIISICQEIHVECLKNYVGLRYLNESDKYVLIRFFTNAVADSIITWVRGGMITNLEDFDYGFTTLHLDCLKYAVDLYAKSN